MLFSDIEREIILALADCDINPAAAARKLYLSRNTVLYHLEKVEDRTGLNARRFYDLVKLVEGVTERDP